jgi:hypothetical protein
MVFSNEVCSTYRDEFVTFIVRQLVYLIDCTSLLIFQHFKDSTNALLWTVKIVIFNVECSTGFVSQLGTLKVLSDLRTTSFQTLT